MIRFLNILLVALLASVTLVGCTFQETYRLRNDANFYQWVQYLIQQRPDNKVQADYLLTSTLGPPTKTEDTLAHLGYNVYVWNLGGKTQVTSLESDTSNVALGTTLALGTTNLATSHGSLDGLSVVLTEYCIVRASIDEDNIVRNFSYDGTKCNANFNPQGRENAGFQSEKRYISGWNAEIIYDYAGVLGLTPTSIFAPPAIKNP